MKNISKLFILILAIASLNSCSKTLKVEKADASFVAYKLDGDKVRLESSTSDLTVQLFTKSINGIDQKIAFVEFEFAGTGDLTSIWTGDSCSVVVPSKVDGITGEVLETEVKKFASDYDAYKEGDYTQRGNSLTDNKLVYTYWKAGTYKVYMIASNWGEMSKDDVSKDEKLITITVVE
jgi:hypothetical protein